ncbi:MAG: pilin biogenesis protein [Parcubacteria group bacterium GW2011_GWA2_33_14]|nr:MAG: pilin biogenesis protein [Parcubacteria group bacterium GW2011_GWA2_33_14]
MKKIFLTRFCSNVSTLITAGISINKALSITADTVNNIVYKSIIFEIEKEVSEGEKMSSVMVKHKDYFPPFVVQMIRVGEETGKLSKTLMEVVNFYQKEIKRSIDLFSSLLEPIMIIFLGGIVAMLAISVLSPLYGALGTI